MALACALATTATHAAMHAWLLPTLAAPFALLVAELGALALEALVYARLSRSPARSLLAATLANALSFAAGLLVL
jgi:hypothetical protein